MSQPTPSPDSLVAEQPPAPSRRTAEDVGGAFRVPARAYAVVISLGLAQAACLVCFGVLTLRTVKALQVTAVGAAADAQLNTALRQVGALAVLAVVLGLLRAAEFTAAERAGYQVVQGLRMRMYRHLQLMLPAHLHHRARGGLLLRLTGDLSMLRMWLSRGLLEGISAVIVLVAGLATLAWLSLELALAAVAVLAFGSALSLLNGHSMRQATRTMRRRRSLLIGNIDEQINTMSVIQAAGHLNGEYGRLSRQNDSLTRALIRVARIRGRLRGLAASTGLLITVAVLGVGLIEARRGVVSVPEVVAGLILVRFLTRPVRTLGLAHDYWHRGLVSRQKVVDFLLSSSRDPEEESLERIRVRMGRIEFVDVVVPGALAGVTGVIEPRRIVAVTGSSGAGKSALLQVLARQIEPASGVVTVDDQPLTATAPSSMARHLGVVSPDLPLLRGSVRRNLTYAAQQASPEEIQRVVLGLGLDEALARAGQEGVKTWLLEGGRNLPASDRQLVALGRALMGNPTILLLDEPLIGLDGEARTRAREMIIRHRGTVIWVTQDDDDIELADEVWMMHEGRILDVVSGADHRDRRWLSASGGGPRWRDVII
jgi:ATP-binding cassette, subfamily B, bacterial